MVGTQLAPGQARDTGRQTAEFALLPTFQGVAVEPLSDRLRLTPDRDGFRLFGQGADLALTPEPLPDDLLGRAAALSQRFDLPVMPQAALRRHLDAQLIAAATAPPLARGRARIEAARTMLALGLGREAEGALLAAAADDPRLADDPDLRGLQGMAAILAGHPAEAEGLLDARLSGTDEVALWRALRQVLLALPAAAPAAAAALAVTTPLLLAYPDAIRDRLLAPAIETMETGGQASAAAPVLAARPSDPRLALARAMAAEAGGDVEGALHGYDKIAAERDRLARFRAAMRAIDLRLTRKAITPAGGIEALERLDVAWRGDGFELARRNRLAELRLETGAPRAALALWRESAGRFPDAAPALRARMKAAVSGLLAADATTMGPLDFVALLEENADLLGGDATAPDMEARLADRLLALDLPDAAAPLLARLVGEAPPGAGRAATGARLAALRLAAGDAPGALTALTDSAADELPAPLAQKRQLLAAEATAKTGDVAAAASALAAIGTEEADRARADILEHAGDLPGAIAALNALAARTIPAQGKLDDPARAIVLRIAALAARANDQATLAALRTRIEGRLGTGADADTLRLLLSAPVSSIADLARAGREVRLADTVAAGLSAPGGGAPR